MWSSSMTYSPDGKILAFGRGPTIKLWDVAGDRLLATLETETDRFAVDSVAFASDGRTLAAAGSTIDAKGTIHQGQVRLYDVAREPFRRRAVLTFDDDEPAGPNRGDQICSDVAFTLDGRRVVAVAMLKFKIWDVATGTEQDSFPRRTGSSSDCLAVSPDGRWLALTEQGRVSVLDIRPPAP